MNPMQIFRARTDLANGLKSECAIALERIGQNILFKAGQALTGNPQAGEILSGLKAEVNVEASRLELTSTDPAAAALEYGTGSRPAQPFLRPAITEAEADIRTELIGAVGRAMKRGMT